VVEEILPAGVCVAERFDDDGPAELFPEEQAVVAGSTPKRRREFATVRACARQALGLLGVAPVALLPGKGRAPRWPEGVVGSMTHCRGYRGAAVARADELKSIGIDAEPALPLPRGVLGMIADPAEQAMLARLAATAPDVCWDRLLFSVKEAVYKAWFPLTERWIRLGEVLARSDADGAFTARVPVGERDRHPCRFDGRWLVRDGLLLAAVAVPAREDPAVPASDASA